MKQILIIIFLIFITISCSKKDTSDENLFGNYFFDREVNDTFMEAIDVSTQNPIVGYFHKKNSLADTDCYHISFAQADVSYKITLTSVPGIDSVLDFYDENKHLLFSVDEYGAGQSERLWDFFPTSPTIYVRVRAKINYNEKVPYYLNFIAKGALGIGEIEPNNSIDTAVKMAVDDSKKGLISPKNDVDFYRIVAGKPYSQNFSVSVVPLSNMDVFFTLIDTKNNIEKLINYNSYGVTEVFNYLDTSKGSYCLRVSGVSDRFDKRDPSYQITLNSLPETDDSGNVKFYEQEFNDTMMLATDLFNVESSDILGTVFPDDDVDWYTFDILNVNNMVNISLSSVRGLDTVIEIYNKKNVLVIKADENGSDGFENISLTDIAQDRYFIKLYAKKGCSLINYNLFFSIK